MTVPTTVTVIASQVQTVGRHRVGCPDDWTVAIGVSASDGIDCSPGSFGRRLFGALRRDLFAIAKPYTACTGYCQGTAGGALAAHRHRAPVGARAASASIRAPLVV
jgi:hypothetical protein